MYDTRHKVRLISREPARKSANYNQSYREPLSVGNSIAMPEPVNAIEDFDSNGIFQNSADQRTYTLARAKAHYNRTNN